MYLCFVLPQAKFQMKYHFSGLIATIQGCYSAISRAILWRVGIINIIKISHVTALRIIKLRIRHCYYD